MELKSMRKIQVLRIDNENGIEIYNGKNILRGKIN